MKRIIVVFCLLLAARVSADDLALAKEVFGKFTEYQKANDPRILDLVATDCTGRIVQSDGTLEVVTLLPPGRFRAGIEGNIKQKKAGNTDTYGEVEYEAFKDSIAISGAVHFVKGDSKGPFQMTLKKDKGGALKISYVSLTFPLGSTPIKGDKLFEFVMPGEWKTKPVEKVDLGEGRALYAGNGTSENGSLVYTVFEDGKTKPEDQDLKEIHWAAIQPIIANIKKSGAQEKPPLTGELAPGDKDRLYFIYPVELPDKSVVRIHGITIRTKVRTYTIFTVGASIVERDLWLAVAESFKEL